MKPVLFPADATAFTSNGLGRLDPTECIVTEERNGQYELACVVPVDSPHFGDIANNMILAVVPGDGGSVHPKDTMQAFRIYMITEPLNGLVTLCARHISYDLSYNTVMPCTASSVTAALSALSTYAVETCPFTFTTDKSTVANWKVDRPQTIRSELGGQQGSILDVYGGEYDWDNFKVKLWNQRGTDTDVTLRYGKNITDISQEQNLESVITGIVPFWMNDTTLVTLTEKSVDSAYASQYPFKRTVPVDFSSEWDTAPTESQLRSRAQSYITANKIGIPKVSIEVSFVALWQTEEYKDIAPLERVHLCDTVGVVFEKYGINTRAEVIKTEWDCLAERYLSIELGEARSRFASTLVEMNQQTTQEIAEAKTELQNAIDAATAAITGNNGGYLKINSDSNGRPYELLIMDTPDISTATKIWRWNLGGLGYSSTGYSGTFGTAITMNGAIVADYITAGTMSANRIRTGLLESTAKKPGTQTPVSSWDLDTGKLVTSDGDFTGTISGSTITGSTITSTNGTKTTTISGGTITTNDLQASSGSFSGTITASNISGSSITGGSIGIGGANNDQFTVDSSGNVTVKAGSINLGWDSTNNRYKFSVDNNGNMAAYSGAFSGAISASTITGSSITSVSGSKSTTINGGSLTTNDITVTGGKITMDTYNYWDLTNKQFMLQLGSGSARSGIYIDSSHFQIFKEVSGTSWNYWILEDGSFRVGGRSNSLPHISLANDADGATFEIYSDSNNYWNLKTGTLKTTHGIFTGSISSTTITGGSIGIGGTNNDQFTVDSSGNVAIKRGSIGLGWNAFASDYNFKVDSSGNMTAYSGTFEGDISASNISGSSITGGSIGIGGTNNDNFKVTSAGAVTIKQGSIKLGWNALENRYDFEVDNYGNLYAYNGSFEGSISGSSISGGTISGTDITGGSITSGGTTGSKIVIQNGVITGYYGNNYAGIIDMVSGGVRIGRSGVFDANIKVNQSSIDILTSGLTMNGDTCPSGTYSLSSISTIVVDNGIITSIS